MRLCEAMVFTISGRENGTRHRLEASGHAYA